MTSVRNVTVLPVVDLRADSGHLRERLREAAHEVGFFYLTGHDVPDELSRRVLEAARRLFELPQADKDAVAMVRSPHFRGYTRLGGELTRGEVDWREQIDIGPERPPIGGPGKPDYLWLQGPNQWPAALPELPGIIDEWDAALSGVARTLLRHWAASLGSPPDVFDSSFAETPATLIKVVRYPARSASSQGVGAHRDAGDRFPRAEREQHRLGRESVQSRIGIQKILPVLPVCPIMDVNQQSSPEAGDPDRGREMIDGRGGEHGEPNRQEAGCFLHAQTAPPRGRARFDRPPQGGF